MYFSLYIFACLLGNGILSIQDFGIEYTVVSKFEKNGKNFYVCRATTFDGEEKSPRIFYRDEDQGIFIIKDFK